MQSCATARGTLRSKDLCCSVAFDRVVINQLAYSIGLSGSNRVDPPVLTVIMIAQKTMRIMPFTSTGLVVTRHYRLTSGCVTRIVTIVVKLVIFAHNVRIGTEHQFATLNLDNKGPP